MQGNGWREEMICAIKAQALASGKVAKLNIAHRNTDAAGQLEDIRNLISAKVNAIVVNPADPAGIKAALEEATKAGIVVVAVDQAVTEPSAYIISNNQEQYAYLGAKWLFEQIGGKGDVVYMRGAAGASADSDRDKGFKKALAEFPDVKVVQEVFTGWQQDQGKQQILDFIATGTPFDGIWTSGIDNVIVDALVESQAPLVPVVGADNAGFVGQLELGRRPDGRGGDQPRLDRRRRRDACAADPRRQEAGAADRAGRAGALGERRPTTARPSSRPRPIRRSARSGRSASRSRTGPPTPRSRSSPARARRVISRLETGRGDVRLQAWRPRATTGRRSGP